MGPVTAWAGRVEILPSLAAFEYSTKLCGQVVHLLQVLRSPGGLPLRLLAGVRGGRGHEESVLTGQLRHIALEAGAHLVRNSVQLSSDQLLELG